MYVISTPYCPCILLRFFDGMGVILIRLQTTFRIYILFIWHFAFLEGTENSFQSTIRAAFYKRTWDKVINILSLIECLLFGEQNLYKTIYLQLY